MLIKFLYLKAYDGRWVKLRLISNNKNLPRKSYIKLSVSGSRLLVLNEGSFVVEVVAVAVVVLVAALSLGMTVTGAGDGSTKMELIAGRV